MNMEEEIDPETEPVQDHLNMSTWDVVNMPVEKIPMIEDASLRSVIETSLKTFRLLLNQAQDLAKFFHPDEVKIARSVQLAKLATIGMMQLQQVMLILNGESIESKSINEFFNVTTTAESLNTYCLGICLEYLNGKLLPLIQSISTKLFVKNDKEQMRLFVINVAKLQQCMELLPFALCLSKEDIFSLPRTHEKWIQLNDCVLIKQIASKEQIDRHYAKLTQGILLANAMISKGAEYQGEFKQTMMTGFGAVYYAFAAKKAKQRAEHFMAEPDKNLAFKAWNLGEQGMLKTLMPLIFPSISYNKKIYLPRQFKSITRDNILAQYGNGTINAINNDVGAAIHNQFLPTLEELYKPDPKKICVRILCSESLIETGKPPTFVQQMKQYIKDPKVFEKIIIHIHGGGFVSMSSRSHQTYTRKWANSLEVPIFSIDYRMAPNDPYPAGLDDCWQAYMFIINYINNYFQVTPKKIALVGDSAGGNLCAALTVQCIKAGVRVPDGILLAYPALYLNSRAYTPSLFVALDDPLLHHTVLKLCVESYITEEYDPVNDPLISPSRASDEILSRFPRTRIVAGTNDPLHDESWRLVQRLYNLKKDVQMIIYEHMPHGFLSFDVFQGMKEAAVTVRDATDILNHILS